jgi:sulfur relay (sulfurtransferase) complex TusBCD TusD component (DsrE family)
MAKFFIVQSREPFTDNQANSDYELIHNLVLAQHEVTVLLIQNGVLPARRGGMARKFDMICNAKLSLFADEFSLRQREIAFEDLKPGVLTAGVDTVISAMLAGHKVIWH